MNSVYGLAEFCEMAILLKSIYVFNVSDFKIPMAMISSQKQGKKQNPKSHMVAQQTMLEAPQCLITSYLTMPW